MSIGPTARNKVRLSPRCYVVAVGLVFGAIALACSQSDAPEPATVVPPTSSSDSTPASAATRTVDQSPLFATRVSIQRTQEAEGDIGAGHGVRDPDSDEPTPTSVPELQAESPIIDGELHPGFAELLTAGAAREFPPALLPTSASLPAKDVVGLWTQFLSNTYIVDATGIVTEYCADGSGFRLGPVALRVGPEVQQLESLRLSDAAFEWRVNPPDGEAQWFEPILVSGDETAPVRPPDGDLFAGLKVSTVRFGVYENPNCGGLLPFEISPTVLDLLLGGARIREFPEALLPGAEPLTWEESIELWNRYVNDSLIVDARGYLMELCSDGTGAILFEPDDDRYDGAEFDWLILPNRGHPTNSPRLKAQYFSGPADGVVFINGTETYPDDGVWRSGPTESETLRFDHPNCGNTR